ncbi:MAG: TRAM domain-containing protein, partial [Acidobacteriaceae bacterium]
MKLTIDKVIYGGQGLARMPEDDAARAGLSVFVPFTLPGEIVEAAITQEHRGYSVAEARQIVEASEFRATPPCPWFAMCGGCQLQHGEYPYQVELKREMLRESLTRAGVHDLPEVATLAGEPLRYRNRIRLQLQTRPEFSIGYRQAKSHRMTAIEGCPIAAPLLERCIVVVRTMGTSGLVPVDAQEIELFTN